MTSNRFLLLGERGLKRSLLYTGTPASASRLSRPWAVDYECLTAFCEVWLLHPKAQSGRGQATIHKSNPETAVGKGASGHTQIKPEQSPEARPRRFKALQLKSAGEILGL